MPSTAKKDRFDKMRKVGRSDSPYTMYEDCDGIYWIGTWGEGLWKYDKSNETIERQTIRVSGTQREDSIFYSIIQDDVYRYLWVLAYSELHVLKHEKGQLSPIDISQFIDPNMMFTKTMKDKNGNLCPNAACLVTLNINGNGEIMAVGNADRVNLSLVSP